MLTAKRLERIMELEQETRTAACTPIETAA